jgi:hypothetical protein
MPDEILVCKSCGQKFKWTEKDQRDYVGDEATGDILDGHDPKQECKSCRVKQDGQRS